MDFTTDFYLDILETLESAIIILSPTGEVIYGNSTLYKTTGFDKTELVGTKIWDTLIPDEERDKVNSTFQKLTLNQGKSETTNFIKTKSNKYKLFKWQNTNYLTKDGDIKYIVGTGLDITDYEDSKTVMETYQNAVNQSLSFCTTNKAGVFTYVNDFFCKSTGYSKDELLGQTHQILNSNFHTMAFFNNLWETILAGKSWFGEIRNKNKSGTTIWTKTLITPIIDSQNIFQGFSVLREDLTEQKDMENELLTVSKLATLGEMSGQILHEISNPLAIIKGYSKNIKKHVSEDSIDANRLREDLDKLENGASKITNIFLSLKNSLLEAKNEECGFCNLSESVGEAMSLVQYRLKETTVKIEVHVGSDIEYYGSKGQITQVVLNLLTNAIQSVKEQKDPWVRLAATVIKGDVWVSVTDSGKMISEELQGKIFETLFTTKSKTEGTGLGLSFCQRIIQFHKGQLSLDKDSEQMKFRFNLKTTKF